MRTKKMRTIIKWTSYVLFALFLFCLQTAPERLGLFSDVLFLLPFAVAFACYEEIIPSMIMAAVCGFFWDYSVQRQFGFNALVLCIICVAAALVMKFYIRPVYVSVIVTVAAATLIHCLADFFFFFVLKGYSGVTTLLLSHYIPSFFKTVLFGAGISFVVKKIYDCSPIRAKFDED